MHSGFTGYAGLEA